MRIAGRRKWNQRTSENIASGRNIVSGLVPKIWQPKQREVNGDEYRGKNAKKRRSFRRPELCITPQVQCTGPAACTRGSSLISPKVLS